MSDKVYYPNAIKFPSGNAITQLEEMTPEYNFEALIKHGGSAVNPTFTGSRHSKPAFQFETLQIDEILNRCTSPNNIAKAFPSGGGNIDLEWMLGKDLEERELAASTVHEIDRMTKAMLSWQTINAPADGEDATIQALLSPTLDGSNPPIQKVHDTAITVTSLVQAVYKGGPIAINTTPLNKNMCVESWTWQNQIEYQFRLCSNNQYLKYAGIRRFVPMVDIVTDNIDDVRALLPTGAGLTSFDAYLVKNTSGGMELSRSTDVHIKLSATAGKAVPVQPRTLRVYMQSFTVDTTAQVPAV